MCLYLARHFGASKTNSAVTERHLEGEWEGVGANQRWEPMRHSGLGMHKWSHTKYTVAAPSLCGVSSRIMNYRCALKRNITLEKTKQHRCQVMTMAVSVPPVQCKLIVISSCVLFHIIQYVPWMIISPKCLCMSDIIHVCVRRSCCFVLNNQRWSKHLF